LEESWPFGWQGAGGVTVGAAAAGLGAVAVVGQEGSVDLRVPTLQPHPAADEQKHSQEDFASCKTLELSRIDPSDSGCTSSE
jgi:hypothetical protein